MLKQIILKRIACINSLASHKDLFKSQIKKFIQIIFLFAQHPIFYSSIYLLNVMNFSPFRQSYRHKIFVYIIRKSVFYKNIMYNNKFEPFLKPSFPLQRRISQVTGWRAEQGSSQVGSDSVSCTVKHISRLRLWPYWFPLLFAWSSRLGRKSGWIELEGKFSRMNKEHDHD